MLTVLAATIFVTAFTGAVLVQARTYTAKDSDSGTFDWVYSGPTQDYYVTTKWKWTWHEIWSDEPGSWKGVFHWQEENLAYGEDGKRYTWHNGGKWQENDRSDIYTFQAKWADPWGYREITVYHEAKGEVRVDFFKITKGS